MMMKTILFVIAVVSMAWGAHAQERFSKGDVFLGGRLTGLDMRYSTVEGESAFNFSLQAGGGYFVSNKFAIDGTLGVAYEDASESTLFVFGMGLRYYPTDKFYVRAGYELDKISHIDPLSYVHFEAGYDFFVSENVFLEPSVYFSQGLSEWDESSTIGLSFGIGVRF